MEKKRKSKKSNQSKPAITGFSMTDLISEQVATAIKKQSQKTKINGGI